MKYSLKIKQKFSKITFKKIIYFNFIYKLAKMNKINFKYIKKFFMKDLFHSVKYVMKNKNINKNENYEIEVKFSKNQSCYVK